MAFTREQIEELIKHADGKPEAMGELFAMMHQVRRQKDHAFAKAGQPILLSASLAPQDWELFYRTCRQPTTSEEQGQLGLDYLCQTAMDCLESGDFPDTLFALARVFRKVWAMQPILGPIEGRQ